MTDDERISALFRAAATEPDAPPPGFDHDDVLAASHRITARRRAVLGGVLGLLVIAGIGGAIVLPGSRDQPASTASAPYSATEENRNRSGAAEDARKPAPEGPAAAGAIPQFTGTPLGPGTSGCADRQDPALRAYVEEALPEVVGAPEAAITTECRPGGQRGVNLEVGDGSATGLLTVVSLPAGEQGTPPAGGASVVSLATASGGTVSVSVRPDRRGAPLPFAGRLRQVAEYLSPRL